MPEISAKVIVSGSVVVAVETLDPKVSPFVKLRIYLCRMEIERAEGHICTAGNTEC